MEIVLQRAQHLECVDLFSSFSIEDLERNWKLSFRGLQFFNSGALGKKMKIVHQRVIQCIVYTLTGEEELATLEVEEAVEVVDTFAGEEEEDSVLVED